MNDRAKRALWMTVFGLLTAVVIYLVTDSIWWSIIGLLGAGIAASAVARPRQAH